MKKIIILDRDGVINFDSDHYIKNLSEWKPIPGSLEAIAALSQAGYKVAIVTNQSGIHRGLFGIEALHEIHQALQNKVRLLGGHINGIFFCPHQPSEECHCRKPKTGLFELVANFFQVDLNGVIAIGDAWRDIEAALTVNCSPILVLTGKGEHTLQQHRAKLEKIPIYAALAAATLPLIKCKQAL
jgi:D-glycero-D-manno-heptose 1,7-bisphosphate phosphatase